MGLFEGLLALALCVVSNLHPPPTGDPLGPLIDGAGTCGEPIAAARSGHLQNICPSPGCFWHKHMTKSLLATTKRKGKEFSSISYTIQG